MDNISHSVIGLGVGELLQRSLPQEVDAARQTTRRRLLLFSCWFASNMPDLDLFLTRLLPRPLGYLLHHRGHTHTLLFALPQALLLLALVWLLWPAARRLLKTSASARAGLGAALVLGLLLHLLMDSLNSYGIHPFYPLDARWFYGDMVFIVEPLFWTAFGVPLALAIARPALRALVLLALCGALGFFAVRGFLAWGAVAALLAIGAGVGALALRAGAHSRAALALAAVLCLGFIGLQGAASALGKRDVRAALRQADPASEVLDVSMTAYPSHPLCWSFVAVERNEGADRYRLRKGVLSLVPGWLKPDACPAGMAQPLPRRALTAGIAIELEYSGGLAALRRLRQDNCHVEAWLRFARAPAVDGAAASDLRFGAGLTGNFSTLDLEQAAHRDCPQQVPGWAFPRADLLTPP
ncbi:metal-dependent hydrolase [Janthinobacterium fluminis]|uniref:Metal-dependent hydrolase n=1 Tax=Janthinobacterium fluminis TaxID=2987524 RepID=A0ABT5K2D0_9BURK|nr:metal-dependent hydrolase [Janthinobacterium fluminis]MDC8758835.1 metal-dependent hydrolase [Janthinobacterium fluminis]